MAERRRGPDVQDQRLTELLRLGVPREEARAWLAQQDCEDEEDAQAAAQPLLIWPENLPVWRAWRMLETQWRLGPRGGLLSLRYDQADVLIRRLRLPDGDAVFEQLIEMERAALEAQYHGEQH